MVSGYGVELRQLSVRFGDFVAVRNANVAIEPGEFFSFLPREFVLRIDCITGMRDFRRWWPQVVDSRAFPADKRR